MVKFLHEPTGRIVDLPAHFEHSKVAKNYTLIEGVEELETEKVRLEFTPNSVNREGRRVKRTDPEPAENTEESNHDGD